MPKNFSDGERESIRSSLMKKGRELFASYGLRGTGVEDLARAAGISTGSFYTFFRSKEELYFDLLEEEEKNKDKLLAGLLSFERLTAENLFNLLSGVFEMMENNPVIRRLYEGGELELLMRKLPPDRIEAHMRKDSDSMKELFRTWRDAGALIDEDSEVLAALFRALFFMTFHKQEIGAEQYPRVRTLLLRFISEGLTSRAGNDGREKADAAVRGENRKTDGGNNDRC